MSKHVSKSKKKIPDLLKEYHGNMAAVGRALRVSRSAVCKTVHADAELLVLMREIKESVLDDIENGVIEKALAGSSPDMHFYLKTQGRGRGYVERVEQDTMDFSAMKTAVDSMAPEQREVFLRRIENGEHASAVIRDMALR